MKQVEKKGHNVILGNIVVHRINKSAGQNTSKLILARKVLSTSMSERKFIAEIRESFNKRSAPTHGIFNDDHEYNGFQLAIGKYLSGVNDFMEFTTGSMNYYQRIIETSNPATGSFLIFADYKISTSNERYILILAIDNKQGFNLSETSLTLEEIKNLDLSRIDLAAILNITRWQRFKKDNEAVKTYLTFIRGKKKISDYFQTFIGCADKTTSTESSTTLLNTMEAYFRERSIAPSTSKGLKSKVFDYCQEANKLRKEILLSQISWIINQDIPEDFLQFASDENYAVSAVVKYDSKVLRTLKFIDFKSDDFTIKFNKSLIGKSIKLSSDKRTMTITNLPEELKSQF